MSISLKKIVAASFLLGGTFLMISLGLWQIDRLAWKKEIIHELNRVYNASNLPLYSYQNLEQAAKEQTSFLYGHVKGIPLWDKEIRYGPKAKDRQMGFHVITPIEIEPSQIILVNRGWIAHNANFENKRPNKRLMFTGLIREPDWNSFTPDNSPENDIWTKLDIEQIAQAKQLENVLPYILYAHSTSQNVDAAEPLKEKWYPRNKHAQYATFWFSMAFFFLLFFGYYTYRSKRN